MYELLFLNYDKNNKIIKIELMGEIYCLKDILYYSFFKKIKIKKELIPERFKTKNWIRDIEFEIHKNIKRI